MVKRSATTMVKRRKYAIPELMFHDTNGNTTFTFASLQLSPSQGVDGNQFVGSSLNLKGVDISVYNSLSAGGNAMRVTLLAPKDPSVVPTALNTENRYSERDFTVYYDEFVPSTASNGVRFKRNLTGKMKYNSLGTTVLENNLYLVVNTNTTTNIRSSCRLYYTDP